MKIFSYLVIAALLSAAVPTHALDRKPQKKETSPYEKLFKGKRAETFQGLVTIHKIEGRVYFEIPKSLIGQPLLLGTTLVETTHNGFGSVGEKPIGTLPVVFSQVDTVVSIGYLRLGTRTSETCLQERLTQNARPATLYSFPVKAYNPDSTAVVTDVTDFLLDDIYILGPFSPYAPILGYGKRQFTKEPQKNLGQIGRVRAFADNFSVESSLSYRVTVKDEHQTYVDRLPFTAIVNRSFMRLPENPMPIRKGDPRIAIFTTMQTRFSASGRGVEPFAVANHWRLEPKDSAAYARGELVEPRKPIVFYVDPAFPEAWRAFIKQGVETWQPAFEKIGFKNAIVARDYPTDDPEFDPSNLKYSCIVYSPSEIENAMGPSWVDPRTGEILTASVYLYHNLVRLVRNWRFVHTAAADPEVRTPDFAPELLGDCIRYVVSHELGHCLGLMHNMAASSAIPTDSLRSPSFTQRYGTTYSIMDYARNNYVAQPGDKERGVRLTPPKLGVYDFFTIKWLYSPLLDETASDTLKHWISERLQNPIYRYGKQQIYSRFDPSSIEEDLGDDPMKSAAYGIANLKHILKNLNAWVGTSDPDYEFRQQIYGEIIGQYVRYVNHVLPNIGGIFLNERYDGDPLPSYASVPKERQRRALNFVCDQFGAMQWLEEPTVLRGMPIKDSPVSILELSLFKALLSYGPLTALSASRADSDPYPQQEFYADLYNRVWKPTQDRKKLTDIQKRIQSTFVDHLLDHSSRLDLDQKGSKMAWNGRLQVPSCIREFYDLSWESPERLAARPEETGYDQNRFPGEIGGFSYYVFITPPEEQMDHICFETARRALALVQSQSTTCPDSDTRAHYRLLQLKLERALHEK